MIVTWIPKSRNLVLTWCHSPSPYATKCQNIYLSALIHRFTSVTTQGNHHRNVIHAKEPNKPEHIIAVTIPAPALSPAVIFLVKLEPSKTVGCPPVLDPALGSPFEVPPLFWVTGAATLVIKFAWITLKALICSPTPNLPSHVLLYHILPHVRPLLPPEHCPAAPCAEVKRSGCIVS